MLGYVLSNENVIDATVKYYTINDLSVLVKDFSAFKCIYVIYENKILYCNEIIIRAAEYGHIEILDWLKNSGYDFNKDKISSINGYAGFNAYSSSIFLASINNRVHILEWFKKNNCNFWYNECAVDYAASSGHVQILDWFKNSGYEFKHSEDSIKLACKNGHVQVVNWFYNSGYEFKYNEMAINLACSNNHIKILNWFKNSKHKLLYDENAVGYASKNGHVKILKWFVRNNYYLWYDSSAIMNASFYEHFKILKFFVKNINVKKVVKWANPCGYLKTIRFKTKNKCFKGYKKN